MRLWLKCGLEAAGSFLLLLFPRPYPSGCLFKSCIMQTFGRCAACAELTGICRLCGVGRSWRVGWWRGERGAARNPAPGWPRCALMTLPCRGAVQGGSDIIRRQRRKACLPSMESRGVSLPCWHSFTYILITIRGDAQEPDSTHPQPLHNAQEVLQG